MAKWNPTIDDFELEPEDYCPDCGAELDFEDCEQCGGDGFTWHDGDSEEPWTGYETCESCEGQGGYRFCPNRGCLRFTVSWSA